MISQNNRNYLNFNVCLFIYPEDDESLNGTLYLYEFVLLLFVGVFIWYNLKHNNIVRSWDEQEEKVNSSKQNEIYISTEESWSYIILVLHTADQTKDISNISLSYTTAQAVRKMKVYLRIQTRPIEGEQHEYDE